MTVMVMIVLRSSILYCCSMCASNAAVLLLLWLYIKLVSAASAATDFPYRSIIAGFVVGELCCFSFTHTHVHTQHNTQ